MSISDEIDRLNSQLADIERYKHLPDNTLYQFAESARRVRASELDLIDQTLKEQHLLESGKFVLEYRDSLSKEIERQREAHIQAIISPISEVLNSIKSQQTLAESINSAALSQAIRLETQLAGPKIESAFGRAAFGVGRFGSIFESIGQAAEFPFGQLPLDLLSRDLFTDLSWSDRTEEDEDQSEPGQILLPEDLHEGLIQVKTVPLWVMELLNRCPREVLLNLTWEQFEELIAELCLRLGGQEVQLTRNSSKGDHGLDVVATFVVEGVRTIVGYQAKRNKPGRNVQGEQVRALYGALGLGPHHASRGVVCTTSGFATQAKGYFAQKVTVLSGWGPDEIAERLIKGGKPY